MIPMVPSGLDGKYNDYVVVISMTRRLYLVRSEWYAHRRTTSSVTRGLAKERIVKDAGCMPCEYHTTWDEVKHPPSYRHTCRRVHRESVLELRLHSFSNLHGNRVKPMLSILAAPLLHTCSDSAECFVLLVCM